MRVKVRDLHPNPFRRIERYPFRREKVEALKESLRQTGFWDNVVARQQDSRVEIAYGHHRLKALQEEYGPEHEVEVILRDLDDAHMLQIMAAENMEEWGTSAWVEMETVSAVLRAYEDGRIELAEPERDGAYYRALCNKPITPGTVAAFLGWRDSHGRPSYKVVTAINALDLIAKGVLIEADFAGLGSTQAMALVDQTRRALRDRAAGRLKREAQAHGAAAQSAQDPAAREEANRKRLEAERRAAEQERRGREDAARVGRHVGEGMRSGVVGYKGAARAAAEVLTERDTVLRRMDDYALTVARTANKLLAGDQFGEYVEELLRFRDQLSPQRRMDLALNLRDAAARLAAAAERFAVGGVNGANTEGAPALPATTG